MANHNKTGRSTGPATKAASAPTPATNEQPQGGGEQEGGNGDGDSETTATSPVDLFASVPVINIGTDEVRDLTKLPEGVTEAAARKYETVNTKAKELGIQMKQGWKHANAVFKIGGSRDEKKPTTVMGTIQQIVKSYGSEGCPAIVLVSRLRQQAMTNTRSHFCQNKLPPVGWAEGYVDGALNQKLITVSGQMSNELAAKSLVAAPAEATPEPAKQAA